MPTSSWTAILMCLVAHLQDNYCLKNSNYNSLPLRIHAYQKCILWVGVRKDDITKMQIGKISWLLMRNYILLRTKVVLCFQSKSRQQKIRAVWICRMSVVFCVAFLCASKTSIAPEHQLSLADSLMHFLHY